MCPRTIILASLPLEAVTTPRLLHSLWLDGWSVIAFFKAWGAKLIHKTNKADWQYRVTRHVYSRNVPDTSFGSFCNIFYIKWRSCASRCGYKAKTSVLYMEFDFLKWPANFQKNWFHTCTDLWAIFSFSSPSKIYKKNRKKTSKLQYSIQKCTQLVVLKYSHKTSLILVGRHFNSWCTGKPQHLPLISEYFMINDTGIWPTLDCWKQFNPKSPHRLPHSGCSFSALP